MNNNDSSPSGKNTQMKGKERAFSRDEDDLYQPRSRDDANDSADDTDDRRQLQNGINDDTEVEPTQLGSGYGTPSEGDDDDVLHLQADRSDLSSDEGEGEEEERLTGKELQDEVCSMLHL